MVDKLKNIARQVLYFINQPKYLPNQVSVRKETNKYDGNIIIIIFDENLAIAMAIYCKNVIKLFGQSKWMGGIVALICSFFL